MSVIYKYYNYRILRAGTQSGFWTPKFKVKWLKNEATARKKRNEFAFQVSVTSWIDEMQGWCREFFEVKIRMTPSKHPGNPWGSSIISTKSKLWNFHQQGEGNSFFQGCLRSFPRPSQSQRPYIRSQNCCWVTLSHVCLSSPQLRDVTPCSHSVHWLPVVQLLQPQDSHPATAPAGLVLCPALEVPGCFHIEVDVALCISFASFCKILQHSRLWVRSMAWSNPSSLVGDDMVVRCKHPLELRSLDAAKNAINGNQTNQTPDMKSELKTGKMVLQNLTGRNIAHMHILYNHDHRGGGRGGQNQPVEFYLFCLESLG